MLAQTQAARKYSNAEATDASMEAHKIGTECGIEGGVSRSESPIHRSNSAAVLMYSHNTPPDSPQGRSGVPTVSVTHSTDDGLISINYPSSPTERQNVANKSEVLSSEMDAPLNLSKPKGSPGSSPISSCLRDQRERLTPVVPSPPLNWQQMSQTVPVASHQHQPSALFSDVEGSYLQSRVSTNRQLTTESLNRANTWSAYLKFPQNVHGEKVRAHQSRS